MVTSDKFSLDNVKDILQLIVNKEFSNVSEKRKIITRSKEFALACPICNDSDKLMSKKRGTLYFNSLRYRCFNCGHKTTLLGLMKDRGVVIEPDQKLKLIDYVNEATSKIQFSDEDFSTKELDKLIGIDQLSNWLNTNENSQITEFKPVQKGSKVYKYLVDRKITDFENLWEGLYWHTKDWSEIVLINLNQSKGKVLGFQTRNLKSEKSQRRFKIYSFSEIWNMMYPDFELDDIEIIGYNRLSYLYNIMNVDWSQPITILESYIDSKFFPNSIGCVGTNTDINFILNQEADIRFMYDYDKTGIKKSIEMLNKGYSVFLWERLFEYWASTTKNESKAIRELKVLVKDLNDVAKLVSEPYKKLNMVNWFSKDELDLIWIKNI